MTTTYTDIEAAGMAETDEDKITKEQDEEIMKRKERQVWNIQKKILVLIRCLFFSSPNKVRDKFLH